MTNKAQKRRVPRPAAKTPKPPANKRTLAARAALNNPAISKLDRLVAALRAPKGATLPDLMRITGWQMHSVRGAIAGALKKKRGLPISSTKLGGERVYRIESKA